MNRDCLFIFPEATPSNNKIIRLHWTERRKENNRVHVIMRGIIGPWSKPMERCELYIIRYGSRSLDADNLAGGFKFLIDSLVKNRVIADDNQKCITKKEFNQEKTPRIDERTIVRIFEVTK
jgi:Holliday junction resolvase RusA-like endonuclease